MDTSDNVFSQLRALASRQVTAIGRYYSRNAWKRLTPSEAQAISRAGIDIFTVFEDSGSLRLTVDQGVADAEVAAGQARAAGQPAGSTIYFALEHLPNGYAARDVPGIKTYFEGVHQVLDGAFATGVYSNGVVCAALLEAGLCAHSWLSASRGFEGSRAFYASKRWTSAQDPKVDQNWDGLSVDVNEVQGHFGQFRTSLALTSDKFDAGHGAFSGEPTAMWLTEGGGADRRMQLTEPFWFCDPAERVWEAPKDAIVDGASIPRPLWATVGSPYTGDYRRASIVHDIACVEAGGDARRRRAADRMFYHACREGGCSIRLATILYIGVRIGAHMGRVAMWREAVERIPSDGVEPSLREQRMAVDLGIAAEMVLDDGETDDVDEIERRTDRALSRVSGVDLEPGPG